MPEIKRPLKVFLFHAPGDKDIVRDLYLRLIGDGVDAWLVKERLLPGQGWEQEIRNAVHEADSVIVCLSERFDRESFRQSDVRLAFDAVLEQPAENLLVIPVFLKKGNMPDLLRSWQAVGLFEEHGYELLVDALRARADQIGATFERKESHLPRVVLADVPSEEPLPDEAHVEAIHGTLGILIEEPGFKPEQSKLQRKSGMVNIALTGIVGILFLVMLRFPSFEKEHYLSPTTTMKSTKAPGSGTGSMATATATLIPVPTLATKGNPLNIIFLIDNSSNMHGRRIRRVKSTVSDFISRLDDRYPVSVIQFDTNVELQVGLTLDHAVASQAVNSIIVDVDDHGSCLYDALYAGIQQSSLIPTTKDTQNIIIVLTDLNIYGIERDGCRMRFLDDVVDLLAKHPVATFILHVDDRSVDSNYQKVNEQTGMTFFIAATESEVENTLQSISAAALLLNPESKKPIASLTENAVLKPALMVFVPPGEFRMGNNHPVYLDAFWIDKTEVTNAMYGRCVQAGECRAPASEHSKTRHGYYGNSQFSNYPVIHVSWADASAYCTWSGGRLPTEAEWEKAARGDDGRRFPWGDETGGSDLANYAGQDTTAVGSYPDGASPYGALDMAGNVAEWVADWYSVAYYTNPPADNPLGPDSGEYRVWRGGSWATSRLDWLSTDSRSANLPEDRFPGLGFRCAREAGQ